MGAVGITDSLSAMVSKQAGEIVFRSPYSLLVKRAGLYHPTYQSSTSVFAVPWTSVLAALCLANRVHEKYTYFAGSVDADGVRHFNIARSGWACDEDCRFGCACQ
jgi:hypothetical protein